MRQLNIYIPFFTIALAAISTLQIVNAYYAGEFYYLAICLAIILGILFTRLWSNNLQSEKNSNVSSLFVPAGLIALISAVISFLVYTRFVVYPVFLSYHFAFLLPVLIFAAYRFFILIPGDEYKLWYFPSNVSNEKTEVELGQQTAPVPFVLSKDFDNRRKSRLSVESPLQMPVAQIFYNFLTRYNQSNSSGQITARDNAEPFGWVFFARRGFLSKRVAIDPELTVAANGLQPGENIYAERVFSSGTHSVFSLTGA